MAKKELPNFFEKAQNIGKTVSDIVSDAVKGNPILASEELIKTRLDMCNECHHISEDKKTCTLCGCVLEFKTKANSASCPVRKW